MVSSVLDTSKTIEVIQEIQGTDHHELLEVFFFVNFTYENVMFYYGTRMCRSPGKDFEEAHFGRKLLGFSENGGGIIPTTGHFHGNMILLIF